MSKQTSPEPNIEEVNDEPGDNISIVSEISQKLPSEFEFVKCLASSFILEDQTKKENVHVSEIESLNELLMKVADHEVANPGVPMYVLFSCTFKTGRYWSPLSELAEQVVTDFINNLMPSHRSIYLIIVRIPRKSYKYEWHLNEFANYRLTHVEIIPTLLCWKGPQRLTGTECTSYALLGMLFEEIKEPEREVDDDSASFAGGDAPSGVTVSTNKG